MIQTRRTPRQSFLPWCAPFIGEEEIEEVVDSLRSGWLTTGPKVKRFEQDFAAYIGAEHAVAVSSCTAGLHISLTALDIGPGDEVIVPTMTFCSTANVVVHLGATPVIVDVDENLLIDISCIERAISPKTKAIIPVHYGGQACDLDSIADLAGRHGIPVVEDAAHAVGAEYRNRKIGTHSRAVSFSFYATKNLSIGEGGMITTNDADFAARCRLLSLHGMSRDAWKRYSDAGTWYYDVVEAGYKSNMTDLQAGIGIHQLRKLDSFNSRRTEIATRYDEAFGDLPGVILPRRLSYGKHIFHLYAIQLVRGTAILTRNSFIDKMLEAKIGTSVHFIPLHKHPLYKGYPYRYRDDQFPVGDRIFDGLVSLPCYPRMTDSDVDDVIQAVRGLLAQA
jgi:dTDP-4-amino-4,6-dideoxygalactose transaminase